MKPTVTTGSCVASCMSLADGSIVSLKPSRLRAATFATSSLPRSTTPICSALGTSASHSITRRWVDECSVTRRPRTGWLNRSPHLTQSLEPIVPKPQAARPPPFFRYAPFSSRPDRHPEGTRPLRRRRRRIQAPINRLRPPEHFHPPTLRHSLIWARGAERGSNGRTRPKAEVHVRSLRPWNFGKADSQRVQLPA